MMLGIWYLVSMIAMDYTAINIPDPCMIAMDYTAINIPDPCGSVRSGCAYGRCVHNLEAADGRRPKIWHMRLNIPIERIIMSV